MGRITGTSTAEIEAPIGRVDAVEDVLSAPEWQGDLKDMEELERDAEGHVTLPRPRRTPRSARSSRRSASPTTGRTAWSGVRRRAR